MIIYILFLSCIISFSCTSCMPLFFFFFITLRIIIETTKKAKRYKYSNFARRVRLQRIRTSKRVRIIFLVAHSRRVRCRPLLIQSCECDVNSWFHPRLARNEIRWIDNQIVSREQKSHFYAIDVKIFSFTL